MKYKVGDKVRVKSKQWYDENKNEEGDVLVPGNVFAMEMSIHCGKELIIEKVFEKYYRIKGDENRWSWTDDMFEDETIEQKVMKKNFKCKDEVIIRGKNTNERWSYAIFSHEDADFIFLCGYIGLAKSSYDILPYEGNEYLVGKIDDPFKEEYVVLEKGALVYGFDDIEELENVDLTLGKFKCIEDGSLFVNACPFIYCIPFSKFNPNDIEATKKEILTIRNGKLVKANLK